MRRPDLGVGPALAAAPDAETPAPPLPFALPDITEAEVAAVAEVLRSRWLTTGDKAREFERRFAAAVDAPHAVAVSSCSAALHLSLEALGVGPGDVVYLPTYTFAASAEVVRHVGATPRFVDVEPVTSTLDPARLAEAVAETLASRAGRPAAVMPVHFAGVACDLAAIRAVARAHGLAVVEDAAHAFPSGYQDRPVGWSPPDVPGTACFSFYATKTITTGEGGMLTTRCDRIAERARLMSLHGLSKPAWSRYRGGDWRYDIVAPGYKYNLTDLAAALGTVQLTRSAAMTARRTWIAQRYLEALAGVPALELPHVPPDRTPSWHLFVPRLAAPHGEPERDLVLDRLRRRGIGVSMHFIPLHLHSFWREAQGLRPDDFPVALDCYRRAFSLPLYSALADPDVDRVVDEVLLACRGLS